MLLILVQKEVLIEIYQINRLFYELVLLELY